MSESVRQSRPLLTGPGILARTHERPALPVERVCVANEIGCLHAKKIVPENVSESTLLEARSGSAVRVGNGVGSAVHKSDMARWPGEICLFSIISNFKAPCLITLCLNHSLSTKARACLLSATVRHENELPKAFVIKKKHNKQRSGRRH